MLNEAINQLQDSVRNKEQNTLARAVVTREADMGAKLSGQVAPCCWMYNAPFQVSVSMADGGGRIEVVDKSLRFEDATEADMQRLIDSVQVVRCKCKGCSNLAFDPSQNDTNREGKCEACFMRKLNEEFAKLQEKENAKLEKLDEKYRKQGFTHRVEIWVHAGGDDQQIYLWMRNPTTEQIQAELKKRKSRVLTDYRVVPL